MSHKVQITNITYNRLHNYFPKAKDVNEAIRMLFDTKLMNPRTNAHKLHPRLDKPFESEER